MRTISGTVESIVNNARRLVGMHASADTQREAFSREFGTYPPYKEASKTDREVFALDVVQPVLTERAQAVRASAPATGEAFGRAHRVAVDMGLAVKGQTYRDYLDRQE